MPQLDAVEIVESFWADVWAVRNPDALDRYGTAVWALGADGKLLHNWVERSAWETYQRLTH